MLQSLAVTAAAAGPPRTSRCGSAVGSVSDVLLLCELKHSHILLCSAQTGGDDIGKTDPTKPKVGQPLTDSQA